MLTLQDFGLIMGIIIPFLGTMGVIKNSHSKKKYNTEEEVASMHKASLSYIYCIIFAPFLLISTGLFFTQINMQLALKFFIFISVVIITIAVLLILNCYAHDLDLTEKIKNILNPQI